MEPRKKSTCSISMVISFCMHNEGHIVFFSVKEISEEMRWSSSQGDNLMSETVRALLEIQSLSMVKLL